MKINLYATRDMKADQYGNIMTELSDATLLRSLRNMVNKPSDHLYHTNPEDFELHLVGEYDTDTGMVEKKRNRICLLSQLKE